MASAAIPARRLPTSLRRRVTASSPICWSATAEQGGVHLPGGLSPWLAVGVELVAGLPERPGSQQRHFLQASKDVFVCSVLIYVQSIRASTTIRYTNLRFTYLLTYFHFCETALNSYRFIHQSSPLKFAIHISPFRIKLLFGTPSKLLSKTRLIRDIYLAIQTYLLWASRT